MLDSKYFSKLLINSAIVYKKRASFNKIIYDFF